MARLPGNSLAPDSLCSLRQADRMLRLYSRNGKSLQSYLLALPPPPPPVRHPQHLRSLTCPPPQDHRRPSFKCSRAPRVVESISKLFGRLNVAATISFPLPPQDFPSFPLTPFFTSVSGSSKRDDNFTCMHVRASPSFSFFFSSFFLSLPPPAPAANNSCTRYLSSSLSLLTLDFRFCSPSTHRGMHLSRIFALGIVSWVGDEVGLREGRRERVVAGWGGTLGEELAIY